MIKVSNRAINFKMANSLQTHDFAFVLRSNGDWTHDIVAHKGLVDTSSRDVTVAHNGRIETSSFAHKGLTLTYRQLEKFEKHHTLCRLVQLN